MMTDTDRKKQEPLVWSLTDVFRLDVSPEILPHEAEYLEAVLKLTFSVVHRLAAENAWRRAQFDPIYMGM